MILSKESIDKMVNAAYPMPRGACRLTREKIEAKRELLRQRLIKSLPVSTQ